MFDRTEPAIGRTSRQTEAISLGKLRLSAGLFYLLSGCRFRRPTGVTDAPALGNIHRQIPITFGFCTSIHASKSGGSCNAFRCSGMWKENQGSAGRKKLTQMELAEQICITTDHLRAIERGRRACSIDLLVDLSLFFEVTLDHLILGRTPANEIIRAEILQAIGILQNIKNTL